MTLHIEQRRLAQAGEHRIKVLGPEPLTHDRPAEAADGFYRIFGARPGMTISLFDMVVGAGFTGIASAQPCIALNVLFDGAGRSWLLDRSGARSDLIPYQPGRFYLMIAPRGSAGVAEIAQGARFRGMDIRLDPELWLKLGGAGVADALHPGHRYHSASCDDVWVGMLPVSPRLMQIARKLYESGRAGSSDLTIEARALDIIAEAVALLETGRRIRDPAGREHGAIERVKAAIMADLARSWTVGELAQLAGLSERRLKEAFPAATGVPVYAWLQEARLLEARRVIETGTGAVTAAALSVGYNSPSHFATLFRRRFGVSPSRIREGRGRTD